MRRGYTKPTSRRNTLSTCKHEAFQGGGLRIPASRFTETQTRSTDFQTKVTSASSPAFNRVHGHSRKAESCLDESKESSGNPYTERVGETEYALGMHLEYSSIMPAREKSAWGSAWALKPEASRACVVIVLVDVTAATGLLLGTTASVPLSSQSHPPPRVPRGGWRPPRRPLLCPPRRAFSSRFSPADLAEDDGKESA